jgi:hypothetical protein
VSFDPELAATPDDPWLGVNVLTEFVFCPRAGIIQIEKQQEDSGEEQEDPRANVHYMPPHQLTEIIQEIERVTRSMMRWLPVPLLSLLITLAAAWRLGWCPAMVGIFFTAGMLKPVFSALHRLRELKELYQYAESRKPAEPDPAIESNQPVDWWELHKAGFEVYMPPRKLEDEQLRLVGRPWRILRRGGEQIPVFKKRADGENATSIYEQHYARMAAYCRLLESCTGSQSPYGIILFGYTFRGVAINAGAASKSLRTGLANAREAIRQAKRGEIPPAPVAAWCSGCPHGKPFVKRNAETRVIGKVIGIDGREYRSECGDRFSWIPPHAKALEKQLRNA